MEEMQDKWYAKEKAHTYEKAKKNLDTYTGSKEVEKDRRRVRYPSLTTQLPDDRHRSGPDGDRNRIRMG